MLKTISFVIIILFVSYACASSECAKENNDKVNKVEFTLDEIGINLKQVFVWINMMPGPDFNPRINITGEIEVTESSEYEIEQITLSTINIYQNDLQFYSIEPIIRFGENPSGDSNKLLIFSTKDGMNVKENFDVNAEVDVEFIFELDGSTFPRYENNLVIQKAY